MKNMKSVEELLAAYANDQRHFIDLDLGMLSFRAMNLSGIIFQECFLLCDFSAANLEGARFERCNIKTVSFREANLTDATITKCAVEGIDLTGASIENLKFDGNYCMGSIMSQSDLEGFR